MLTNLDGTFRLIYNFEIDFNKDELLHHKKANDRPTVVQFVRADRQQKCSIPD